MKKNGTLKAVAIPDHLDDFDRAVIQTALDLANEHDIIIYLEMPRQHGRSSIGRPT